MEGQGRHKGDKEGEWAAAGSPHSHSCWSGTAVLFEKKEPVTGHFFMLVPRRPPCPGPRVLHLTTVPHGVVRPHGNVFDLSHGVRVGAAGVLLPP